MKDYEYDIRSASEFHHQMMEADKQSLAERKEACKDFLEAMRDPSLVAERLRWLLLGNYGHGAMQAANRAVSNKRSNRPAILTHLIGTLEWGCPARMAASAWKELAHAEKQALDHAIKTVIKEKEAGELDA